MAQNLKAQTDIVTVPQENYRFLLVNFSCHFPHVNATEHIMVKYYQWILPSWPQLLTASDIVTAPQGSYRLLLVKGYGDCSPGELWVISK